MTIEQQIHPERLTGTGSLARDFYYNNMPYRQLTNEVSTYVNADGDDKWSTNKKIMVIGGGVVLVSLIALVINRIRS